MKPEQPRLARVVQPKNYPLAAEPTLLATSVSCEVEGGAFVLKLAELRTIGAHDHVDRFAEGNSGFIEIGRYVVTPLAFQHMKSAIATAEAYYVSHYGALPDPKALLAQASADGPTAEAELRLGFRQS